MRMHPSLCADGTQKIVFGRTRRQATDVLISAYNLLLKVAFKLGMALIIAIYRLIEKIKAKPT
jgi:hypothetical protein